MKKNQLMNVMNSLIYLLPILSCFDSYCLFYVSTLPITLSFLSIACILLLSLFNFKITKRDLSLVLILVLLLVSSSIVKKFNIFSMMLYLFYFLTFFLAKHTYDEKKMFKMLKKFLVVINIFAIIAIIQFSSNFINIPRFDIVINNHMVEGFNRTNLVYIGNFILSRSNSLYLEPSTLSQYSVLGMIVAGILLKKKLIKKRKVVFCFILNLIALITSIAGTGLLVLGIVLVVYIFRERHTKTTFLIIVTGIFSCIVVFFLLPEKIRDYLIQRILEITDSNMSGGMRFTYPYYLMVKTWGHSIIGFGAGNETIALELFYPEMLEMQLTVASGFAKIGIELGIPGLTLLLYLIHRCKNKEFYYIYLFMVLINFIGGNLLQPYFWTFMLLFNIYKNNKIQLIETINDKNIDFQEKTQNEVNIKETQLLFYETR